jgi:hypothetical protein
MAKAKSTAAKESAVKTRVEEVEAQPARRVVFSSDEKKYGKPPDGAQVGLKKIALPDAETQLAGFEHEDAEILVKAVRGYKWLEGKGGKQ